MSKPLPGEPEMPTFWYVQNAGDCEGLFDAVRSDVIHFQEAWRAFAAQERKDAERYRVWRAAYVSDRIEQLLVALADCLDGNDVDAAIDAARKESSHE